MTEYITISSIGVSKESQFRAAKIIEVVCNGSQNVVGSVKSESFFEYGRKILSKRWQKLRETIQNSEYLILPKYPQEHCLFSGKLAETLSGTYVMFNFYENAAYNIFNSSILSNFVKKKKSYKVLFSYKKLYKINKNILWIFYLRIYFFII